PDASPAPDAAPPPDASPDASPDVPGDEVLVVVTLNTHSFQEGPDSIDKLRWIGEGLAALDADLVGLNEVMFGDFWAYDYHGATYDGLALIQAALERASGVPWYTARFPFARWADGEEMCNAALSRTPILEHDQRALTTTDAWPAPEARRSVGYIRVEIPRLGWVNFFVAHTWGWDSADTQTQIHEVKAFMAEKFRQDEALDLLVGDLNVPAGGADHQAWLDAPPFRLVDTWAMANPTQRLSPSTFDGAHRIDYVLAGEGWALSEDPNHYEASWVFDGEAQSLPRVSDHKGQVTRFWLSSKRAHHLE
ncbi:hypothetical protein KKB55_19985, partial [Myxococcota bacterium]|nr:hypothetical protein [Myxococcota bacterium]